MLKAVIFDMDGVIFDSEPLHVAHEQALFRSFGLELTEEEHNTYIGTTSHYMWELVKNRHNLENSVEELVEMDRGGYFKFISENAMDIYEIKGVRDFIIKLYNKGYRMAVASSSPINVIERVIRLFKLDKYFDVLVTGDVVERSKPEPDIFLYTAKKLNIPPEYCLVVEDSRNGTIAAKRAGMKCLGYVNINSGNQDLSAADITIDAYKDIGVDSLDTLFNESERM